MILFTGHCTSGKQPQARLMLAHRAACGETLSAIRTAGGECFAVAADVTSEDDVLRLTQPVFHLAQQVSTYWSTMLAS